jgi:hypothetical protein
LSNATDNQITFQIIQTATLIVAVFVAWISTKKQRETIKKDKTIGLLMKDLEDDFLTDGLKILRKIDEEYSILSTCLERIIKGFACS